MIIIEIGRNDNIEKALKTLKSKVIKTKQQKILFERKEFVKPSVQKRTQKLKAIYSQRQKQGLN
jgi:small subunit ribosomal protein S21